MTLGVKTHDRCRSQAWPGSSPPIRGLRYASAPMTKYLIALFLCLCASAQTHGKTTICAVTEPRFQFKAMSWTEPGGAAKLTFPTPEIYDGKLTRTQPHDFGQSKYNLYFRAGPAYFADEIELVVYPVAKRKFMATGVNYRIVDGVRYVDSTIVAFSVECNSH